MTQCSVDGNMFSLLPTTALLILAVSATAAVAIYVSKRAQLTTCAECVPDECVVCMYSCV